MQKMSFEKTQQNTLRTLKDIEQEGLRNTQDMVIFDRLRQEAINWIKELNYDNLKKYKRDESIGEWGGYVIGGLQLEQGYEQSDRSGIIKFIKHFFNISEEDLSADK